MLNESTELDKKKMAEHLAPKCSYQWHIVALGKQPLVYPGINTGSSTVKHFDLWPGCGTEYALRRFTDVAKLEEVVDTSEMCDNSEEIWQARELGWDKSQEIQQTKIKSWTWGRVTLSTSKCWGPTSLKASWQRRPLWTKNWAWTSNTPSQQEQHCIRKSVAICSRRVILTLSSALERWHLECYV